MRGKIVPLLTSKRTLIIACVLLLVTNIVTISFLAYREVDDKDASDYPYIDIAREYIPQEHFIVNIQPLREELQAIARKEKEGTVSIYFEFLNTGANVQIANDSYFYPASLVKLPTALVAMKKIEDGEWHLGNKLVLFEQDKDSRYGTLYQQPVGTSFTIEELLKKLLTESDNTAHKILMRNMSEDELNELKDAIGLNDLFNEKSEITAKEYSRMFRALYNSSFLRRRYSQQLLDWLTQTSFKQQLDAGVPDNVPFAHKIGEDDVEKNYLDSGIVYLPNRPFLMTVMVKEHDKKSANDIMKRVSEAAYKYVSSYE